MQASNCLLFEELPLRKSQLLTHLPLCLFLMIQCFYVRLLLLLLFFFFLANNISLHERSSELTASFAILVQSPQNPVKESTATLCLNEKTDSYCASFLCTTSHERRVITGFESSDPDFEEQPL